MQLSSQWYNFADRRAIYRKQSADNAPLPASIIDHADYFASRLLKKASCRLLTRSRGKAREKSTSEAYLQYVAARRLSGNEAYGSFSAACKGDPGIRIYQDSA